MSVSSIGIATFGSAAIATPPVNDVANAKPDDKPANTSSAEQVTQAAKSAGTGQLVDKTA